ncbi:MAG: ATP-dependent helicase [Candidatus Moranbacteria bacterium]|nr:ATP-dependent helicase [Candidatus Moranbacteria bacterium]
MTTDIFDQEIKRLNDKQKEAVSAIEGPVMVVAGPGTGKTQVLALRIGNILKETDTPAESVLCLTFTNSGVSAMKDRLERYLGKRGLEVSVSTFHSFAISLIEKYYDLLDFETASTLLGDDEAVFLVDDILNNYEWEYISPLSNRGLYFGELKQLISLLKRERITASDFLSYIEADIDDLKNNPDNISSRGETKGELKKEVTKKIESFEKSKEVVRFYEIYEDTKKKLSLMDYDDVLEYAVFLAENFEDVRNEIRENYLYVLVDEHQDSSGVQNSFLKAVWQDVENPNIFVVGDDRQLIYGFSGANSSYFEEFAHIFGKAKLIFLTENYRSTASILRTADDLLSSSLSSEKLNSNKKGEEKIALKEYSYPRDEILGAGVYFKDKIEQGVAPEECALLVPRNYQVKTAINILSQMGLPVQDGGNLSLFKEKDSDSLRTVLKVISDPMDSSSLAKTLLDKTSGISLVDAHQFLKDHKFEDLSLGGLLLLSGKDNVNNNLFESNAVYAWSKKLENWIERFQNETLSNIVNILGNELLINQSENNKEVTKRVEILRSFIHLAILFEGKEKEPTLAKFVKYLDRLDSYNSSVEFATFGQDSGIKVMTLHKSKGLEYEAVWIAHANEEILLSEKVSKIALPEKIKDHQEKRSIEEVKRELYVAITRAKTSCSISYASENYNGSAMTLVSVIGDLSEDHFTKKTRSETEEEMLSLGADIYTKIENKVTLGDDIDNVKELVKGNYKDLKVSVSMLNNFFECPWKWYFRSFLRLPEVKPSYLMLGTVVHETIEFILKGDKLPKDDEIEEKIRKEFVKEDIVNEKDLNLLIKKATKAIHSWVKNYYGDVSKSHKSEYSLSLKDKDFPNLTMYGKIDLVENDEYGEVRVTDFKTGTSKTKNVIEKVDDDGRMSDLMRQLAMYTYLLEGNSNDAKVTRSRLLFLEEDLDNKNSLYETRVDEEKVDMLKRDIHDYEESVRTGDFVDRECHFKSYGSSSECEYCKLAKNLFK